MKQIWLIILLIVMGLTSVQDNPSFASAVSLNETDNKGKKKATGKRPQKKQSTIKQRQAPEQSDDDKDDSSKVDEDSDIAAYMSNQEDANIDKKIKYKAYKEQNKDNKAKKVKKKQRPAPKQEESGESDESTNAGKGADSTSVDKSGRNSNMKNEKAEAPGESAPPPESSKDQVPGEGRKLEGEGESGADEFEDKQIVDKSANNERASDEEDTPFSKDEVKMPPPKPRKKKMARRQPPKPKKKRLPTRQEESGTQSALAESQTDTKEKEENELRKNQRDGTNAGSNAPPGFQADDDTPSDQQSEAEIKPEISASDKHPYIAPTKNYDDSIFEDSRQKKPTVLDQQMSGYHGGDEYEIMDKVIKEYSQHAQDTAGNSNKQLMLSRKMGRRTAEVLLEACHKLKRKDVRAFVQENFDDSWEYYDQNDEGWIRYEEAFQFVRHLFGRLNNFVLAPGSISDLSSGGTTYPLPYPRGAEETKVGKSF